MAQGLHAARAAGQAVNRNIVVESNVWPGRSTVDGKLGSFGEFG
jgi:hypothetical protein